MRAFDTAHASAHPLAPYGWDEHTAESFAPHGRQGLIPARVVRVDRGRCDAVTADGTVRADSASVTGPDPVRTVCTGDWAALGPGAGGLPEVRALLPRRTAFVRSTSSKRAEGQVLAANVDHAVIAVSLATEPDLGRLERFLALAWESGAQPLVVLTKADLAPDAGHVAADAEAAAPGVPVLSVSARTGEGLDALAAALCEGTAVLLGQSGAGKSTLVNALVGQEVATVQSTRSRDGKGRHTTTGRELFLLPGGGVLIDTPGLRGVGLWDAGDGVGRTFADVEELARECRFPDCAHTAEPGCAVLAAVDDGTLPVRRLDSYRKLLRENEYLAARTDARLRAELRRDWKRKQALGRHMAERKRGPRR
ncbi:ribosome small subunit-dependent GTPase A [Streptomyces sp. TRM 70361]|uniref:ribosome small subunit-dependent GTPase A n=1 Tax=Streptomyces sp. TRM 70361 TaxID=3116553 RepID=UPI002E7B988B|nr:ribosome small subunit-dependent GTPase A [Streptomyces sp. TRM 70361]MEE1941070.1 ribosome small subunit-dependent GTPase A [Streptomyces sp. TRM 70361]